MQAKDVMQNVISFSLVFDERQWDGWRVAAETFEMIWT